MSNNMHEMIFKLQAMQDASFPKAFVDATQKVGGLQQKLQALNSADLTKFQQAQGKLQIYGTEVSRAKEKLTNLTLTQEENRRQTQNLTNQWAGAYAKANQLKSVIAQTATPTKEQTKEVNKLEKKTHDLRQQIVNLNTSYKSNQEHIRHTTEEIKKLEQAQRIVEKSSAMIRGNLANASKGLMDGMISAKSAMISSVGMLAPLKHSVEKSLEIELMGAQIRKNIHYHDENEYQQHMKELLSISKSYAVSQENILHMAEQASAGTIKKEEIHGITLEATKMAQALKMPFEEAMQKQIEFRVGLQLTQQQANSLTDAMVTLGDNSANSAGWLSSFAAQAGQQAKQMGMSTEMVMAYGSALTGLQPEKAATGFKTILESLTKGNYATKSQAAAFTKLKLNVVDMQEMMQTDAVGAVNKFLDAMEKIPPAERAALGAQIVGSTGSPILAQLLNNRKLVDKQVGLIKNGGYEGRTDKEADIVNNSTINKIQMMKNAMEGLQLTIADTLLPTLSELAETAQEFFAWLQPIIERHKEFFKWTLILGGGFTLLIGVISSLGFAFMGIQNFVKVTKMITAAQWLWNLACAANPMVLIVGAIVIAVGGLLYYLHEVYGSWGEVWAAIKKCWEPVDTLLEKFSPIYKMAKEIGKALGWLGDSGDKNINVNMKNETLDNEIKAFQAKQKAPQQNVMNYTFSPNIAGIDNPQAIQQTLQQYGQKGSKQGFDLFDNQMRMAN